MAKKKTGTRKKSKKKSRSTPSFKTQVLRSIAGLAILVFLVCVAGVLTHHFFKKEEKIRSGGNIPIKKSVRHKIPRFEIYPKEETPAPKPLPEPPPPISGPLPKVAIIIDDLGYDIQMAQKFIDLDVVLTFSMLPHSPFGETIARAIHKKGVEIMLHLPMEPDEYPTVDPGPGTLLTSMPPDDLITQLEKNLDAVPFIKGVNNHMGSKMTASSTQMYQIFSILKKKGLFYIDSRTTPNSLCKPSARLLQIPFAQRDIFLDHLHEAAFIRKQIAQLVLIAQHRGVAVGIAHPNLEMYDMLHQMLPALKEKVRFVKASEVVRKVG
jgi:uncharacterized protein